MSAASTLAARPLEVCFVPLIRTQGSGNVSKYQRLGDHFKNLKVDYVTLTFREIERILDFELPPYVHTASAWRNADIKKRPQAQQWLQAGWRREKLDLERKEVSFRRVETEATIAFLAQTELDELEQADEQQRQIEQDAGLSATEKKTLINARIGQGQFRKSVSRNEQRCRLTGVSDLEFLIASHIKPWKDCDNRERLDGDNGLMLAPHVDRLFDRGWISFKDNGDILVADGAEAVISDWGLSDITEVGEFNEKQQVFLRYHRAYVFRRLQSIGACGGSSGD